MKRSEVDRTQLSPMMAQYMEIKDAYPNELLFYRLGDFYELFFEDGLIASKELELALTGRAAGLDERVPMCGVPYHAVKSYIEKLIDKGYRVAICEQLEDPRYTKGMVKRGVIDVISKGTVADLELLDSYSNSYIASLLEYPDVYLVTILDITTGKLLNITLSKTEAKIINLIEQYQIKEIVFKDNSNQELINKLKNVCHVEITFSKEIENDLPKDLFWHIEDARIKIGVGHLYYYLIHTELKDLSGISEIKVINQNEYIQMDIHTIRNLELIETMRNKEREYSLLWLLDKCKTAMGSRKLKEWILNPIRDISLLNERYDKIEVLHREFILKDQLKANLESIYDIERLTGKVTNGSLNARDLLQLKKSLLVLPSIKDIVKKLGLNYEISTFEDLASLLDKAIDENPPIGLKEGGMIKQGYNQELDELKQIRKNVKEFIASFEAKVKNETGIKNLKVGFNKVFGYYIEVSKGQVSEVKKEFGWERRQTLANYERYISPELKEKEAMILNAEERIIDLEYALFDEIRERVKKDILHIRMVADILSELDVITSFATVSEEKNFVRPNLNNQHLLKISGGRHPVVEAVSSESYVDNDCFMDDDITTLLITGPNMSGKSTYMRQIAIIIIMAQIGSFVPCKEANLPIIDKIFTRIGASDDLVGGQSTFMVEMLEANNAIMNATVDSLILFDELGRGTATYDGIALAQSILEYVTTHIKCKTLFSTHYHELTSLDSRFKMIKNVHVDAKEDHGKLIFLHKVKDGPIDKSYGIHVASLANMPSSLIDRANEILSYYEKKGSNTKSENVQLAFNFEEKKENDLQKLLDSINPIEMTPLEALNLLYKLKEDNQKKV